MEQKNEDILQKEEMEWILKSWPMWIRLGDKNTKLFQSFASHRQNSNAIWELSDDGGNQICSQENLQELAKSYFCKINSDTSQCDLNA